MKIIDVRFKMADKLHLENILSNNQAQESGIRLFCAFSEGELLSLRLPKLFVERLRRRRRVYIMPLACPPVAGFSILANAFHRLSHHRPLLWRISSSTSHCALSTRVKRRKGNEALFIGLAVCRFRRRTHKQRTLQFRHIATFEI